MEAVATIAALMDAPAERATREDADRALLERCRAGERRALDELYRRHRAAVYGVVARMISNDADREEVLQDVFLQVFRSLESFRASSKLSTWIHRVAVNVTLQHIRRKGRRVRLNLREELPEQTAMSEAVAEPASPELDLVRRERGEAVRRALDALAPKKRAVLVLADFEGRSSTEIAEIVGAPALTVRTRLFYARKAFYARLTAEPAFAGHDFERGGER